VQSDGEQLQVIELRRTTRYVRTGGAAAITDLKVGAEVEVRAELVDGVLEAAEVRFAGTAAKTER